MMTGNFQGKTTREKWLFSAFKNRSTCSFWGINPPNPPFKNVPAKEKMSNHRVFVSTNMFGRHSWSRI